MLARAFRGVRQQFGTQILSLVTVALALFCLAGALLLLENAGAMERRWGAPARMTVYLTDGASADSVESLRSALATLPEVEDARYVSPSDARATLSAHGEDSALANAPTDLFPATIELRLSPATVTPARLASVAERVRRLPMVSDTETYRGLTERLRGLLTGGRAAALAIALGVLLCVFAVVSNTVRMSLQARMREIEVMRLVGATRAFVRTPFLVEGALLGGAGAVVALVVLGALYLGLRGPFEQSLGMALGLRPVFLSWSMLAGIVVSGCALGALGSAAALRRGLTTGGAV